MTALEDNWTALMVAAILEIVQSGLETLEGLIFSIPYALMQFPFFGLPLQWCVYIFAKYIYVDWSRTYAHGAQGDIRMARNNSRCAANIYVSLAENLTPDY